MLRKLHVLALAAVVALGGLTAAAAPASAGHRGGFSFSIGFGDYYGPRYPRRHFYRHHVRPRYHRPYYRYRHHDLFPGYYVPLYRRYEPPIVYRPRVYHRRVGASSHVQWCYSRYRSYRAWDNTFQPYYGPRRQCRSPFGY